MLRRLLVPLLVLAALGAGAPAALADPDFLPAADYPLGLTLGSAPPVAFSDGGQATGAWIEVVQISPPIRTVLHVASRPVGGVFSDELTLPSTPTAVPADVKLAVAPNGAAVVAWQELTADAGTPPSRYLAAYRPAGSHSWEAPTTLFSDGSTSSQVYPEVFVAIGTDGSAAAGVSHIEPNTFSEPAPKQVDARIDVAVRPPAGAWGPVARVSPVDQSSVAPTMAFDGAGNLTLAWGQRFSEGASVATSDDSSTLIVRRRSASNGVYNAPEDITGSDITATTGGGHLAVGADGRAVLAYQYAIGGTLHVWAALRQSINGSWTPAPGLHVTTGDGFPEAVGVAPDGAAYVQYGYWGPNSGASCVGAVRSPAASTTFSAPTCISPLALTSYSGALAFAGSDAIMAWTGDTSGGSNHVMQAARWRAGAATADAFRDLDTLSAPVGIGGVASDGDGGVGVFWATSTKVRVAAYDGGAPHALSTGIPATGTAGSPVTMAASFVDLWSALGAPPSWTFGDGATGSGDSVTHSYAAPGTYAVTVRAHDARGNERTTTGTVTITTAPAAPGSPAPAPAPGPAGKDATAPTVTLTLPKCARRLARAPCTLTGRVADDRGGALRVEVSVVRGAKGKGKKVLALAGAKLRQMTTSAASRAFVRGTVRGATWSLTLPKLRTGTWTVRVRATDAGGNVSHVVSRKITLR